LFFTKKAIRNTQKNQNIDKNFSIRIKILIFLHIYLNQGGSVDFIPISYKNLSKKWDNGTAQTRNLCAVAKDHYPACSLFSAFA